MKNNSQILTEIVDENGFSKARGALGGKNMSSEFVRRVIREGDVNQAISYDDGLNGPRTVRPVEIMNTYAYFDCLGELVKAGARLDFKPHGETITFEATLLRGRQDDVQLRKALKGEIGIGLGDTSTGTIIKETALDKQLRDALVRCDGKAANDAIDAGANVHIKIDGDSTLHLAVYGDIKLVDKILERGVPIESRDSFDYTPLNRAGGNAEMVEHLLDKGADFYAGSWEWKNTVLHSEISNEIPKEAMALIRIAKKRGLHFETPDIDGKTVLHLACMVGLNDVVQALIDNGANVHAEDKFGRTPLHYAALRGNEVAMRALLRAEAKLNVQDKEGNTPLHLCYSGEKMLRDLLNVVSINPERGAGAIGDGQWKKPWETTVLEASMDNRRKIAQALMAVGAKRDIKNVAGRVPQDMPGYHELSTAKKQDSGAGIFSSFLKR